MVPKILFPALFTILAAGCVSRSGDDLALEGNLAGALDTYCRKDTYTSHLKMGMLHQTQRDHHDAIAHFSQAIPMNADADYRVYQYRAESYLATGETSKAKADLEEALRRNPKVPQVHFLMADIFYKENQLEAACLAYSRALDEVGSHTEFKARILKNRALVHFQRNAYMNAAEDYQAAVKLHNDITREDRYNLGLLLYAAGREAEARNAWSGLNSEDQKRLQTLLNEKLGPGF